jgi:hypothetical protein
VTDRKPRQVTPPSPDAAQVRAETVKFGGSPQPLATPAAVAAYLGIPEKTLTDWRCRKEGPDYLPVGRYVRYRWPVVISWAEAREIKLGTAA